MNRLFFLLMLICVFSCQAQKKTLKYEMKQIHPYCGGARPPADILEKAKLPHPYASKKLICISEKGKVDTLKTNANGLLTAKLSVGTYKLFEPWKYYKHTPDGNSLENYDKTCLEETWKKEDLKIKITKGTPVVENYIEASKCPWNLDCLTNKHMPE